MSMRTLANALIVLGVVLLGYAGLWQFGVAPGSRISVPEPVALQRATPLPVARSAGEGWLVAAQPTPTLALPQRGRVVARPVPLIAPDAADRKADAPYPAPGYAVRLAIPSIKLDTEVKQGGIVPDMRGMPTWQTMPFVAVHYGDLTALVGSRGNAVIAGHVVTLREGNVFRNLYRVDLGDEVHVWDHRQALHTFRIVDVKLVPPTDISVMDATSDRTLTLITCGGTFDPIKREFSDRLIVTAKPVAERRATLPEGRI